MTLPYFAFVFLTAYQLLFSPPQISKTKAPDNRGFMKKRTNAIYFAPVIGACSFAPSRRSIIANAREHGLRAFAPEPVLRRSYVPQSGET
ncbi:MAG: hypothetical protein PUE61_06730 [Clostridiales bacterium]|nr:hypothetical protein [Clostridiales bacterium]